MCQRLVEASPNLPGPHDVLGFVYLTQHEPERAVEHLRQASALSEGDPSFSADFGFVLGTCGHASEAERILGDLKRRAATQYVSECQFAKIAFGLGRVDDGFRHLSAGFEERSVGILDFACAPWFATVREDQRWATLAHRAGL